MKQNTVTISVELYDDLKESERRLQYLRSGSSIIIPHNYTGKSEVLGTNDIMKIAKQITEDMDKAIEDIEKNLIKDIDRLIKDNRRLEQAAKSANETVRELDRDLRMITLYYKLPFLKRIFTKKPK